MASKLISVDDGRGSDAIAVSREVPLSDAPYSQSIGPAQLDRHKDEVLRKIGRNLLLFQQLEGLLKFLLMNGAIDGYGSELQARREEKGAAISKKTMGQLVGDFVKGHLGPETSRREAPAELREVWFSFRFDVEADQEFYEQRRTALADIVAERNELIHHLLPQWNLTSSDSTREVAEYLDRQREKGLAEFEVLRGVVKAFEEARRVHADFLASEEGEKELKLLLLRSSSLVNLLVDIAHRFAREDGCVLLNTASDLLKEHAPEEYASMSKLHGFKSLKALILATGLFDVIEEPTKRGGQRVYYRVKPEWSLQSEQPMPSKGA